MKRRKVKAGIVGCGVISDIYIQNMQSRFSILEVVACSSKRMDSAYAKAEKYGIKAMETEELLTDPEIDLVVNLTPPGAHYDIIKRALMKGKHVYTEKIFTVGLGRAKELMQLADEKGLYLGVAPDTFLGSSMQNARQIIESGLIGTVTSVVAVLNRDFKSFTEELPFLSGEGAGIGFDVGIYYMTAMLSILGSVKSCCGMMKETVTSRTHYLPQNQNFGQEYEVKNEGILAGTLLFANGVIGTVHFNGETVFPEKPILTIYGTEGIVYMADPNEFGGEVRLLRKGQAEPVMIPSNFGYADNSRGLGVAEMAWSMCTGRRPRANKEMAYHALEVLYGIAESSRSGEMRHMNSTFEKLPPLPQGYLNGNYPIPGCQSGEEAALTICGSSM
ncbi:MAG: Gfo/Idh/MocA family oxidoreductase [Lachnospiraceae bacterium]|nr:Gfo/Idh/MocA family oxidoreductase [Lachnospiraceae bacterium]